MKLQSVKILTAIMLVSIALTSCGKRGNGKVTTQERKASTFSTLSISGTFPVILSQDGGSEWVKVETDENLQEYIRAYNNGDELIINMDDKIKIRKSTRMKVYVNVKDLRELNFNSVGNLTTQGNLLLDSVEINSESVGKLSLNITADFMRANLKSVGSTTLKGKVREARINNKSVGSLSAFDLKAQTLMIHNTAIGTAEVYADSVFYIRSSAIGTLHYKGPGEVRELTSEGVGKVEKVQ
ncbi:MAG: DUF2807 domain-containing protein [Chitinophagales bacterium]|nr:DUF2807 domain-containing protein [Chitinophagales bacterium]